jgi:hypothetical protein
MDLRVSPRGRFEIANGRFSIVTDRSELLSQYLRTAITNQLESDVFPSIRAADLDVPSALAEFKLEAQRRIIDIISRSPFGYDFNPSNIELSVEKITSDSILVRILYLDGSDITVITNYTLAGGRLELEEELDPPYLMDGSVRYIEEEVVSNNYIEEVDVSCEPIGPLYVCNKGAKPITENITLQFKAMPDLDRIIARNVDIEGIIFDTIGSKSSRMFHISVSGSEDNLFSPGYDSILLSSFLKNRGTNFKILNVSADSGDIRLIRYIPSIEDWLIEVSTEDQDSVSVNVESIEAVDKSSTYVYQDAKSVMQVDNYAFPNESVRGRKFYILEGILSPGVYTLYYRGIVKNRYNGSIEEG